MTQRHEWFEIFVDTDERNSRSYDGYGYATRELAEQVIKDQNVTGWYGSPAQVVTKSVLIIDSLPSKIFKKGDIVRIADPGEADGYWKNYVCKVVEPSVEGFPDMARLLGLWERPDGHTKHTSFLFDTSALERVEP